jgi:hypothetical protein
MENEGTVMGRLRPEASWTRPGPVAKWPRPALASSAVWARPWAGHRAPAVGCSGIGGESTGALWPTHRARRGEWGLTCVADHR